jgi:hypothetical protein
MFISTEIRLDMAFDAARDKLADLVQGGLFGRASGGAYDRWQAGLARTGPRPMMLGMYRITRVRVTGVVTHEGSAVWAMRWEVADHGDTLAPALDADIKLAAAGPAATVLAVSGVCRSPLARLAGPDTVATYQAAQAAIDAFTSQIATDIADPATGPDTASGTVSPEPAPEAVHRDRMAG